MDDDFPFALFETTREEWEAKRLDWAEWDRERAERRAADEDEKLILADEAVEHGPPSSLWQRSYVRSLPDESPVLTLFGLGCHLAELIDDLRGDRPGSSPPRHEGVNQAAGGPTVACTSNSSAADSQYWIDTLNRDFMSLREAVTGPGTALVEPVASKLTEHLLAVAETRSDLRAKCLDLDRQLFDLARRLSGNSD